jgi:ABC-type lipoprotein export system ATPase subunit
MQSSKFFEGPSSSEDPGFSTILPQRQAAEPPDRGQKDEPLTDDLQVCPGEPLIVMAGITKTFKTPAGEFQALKGVDACFYPGEFVSVVGKSGSGKSTLINMLTGIDHPTGGRVRVGGTYIHDLNESKMSLWRGRHLGIVFQFFQLLPMLSLLENVVLPMDLCSVYSPEEREDRAMELLGMVGLEAYAHALPQSISGGQQQSAAVARALANDPAIILADEPTGNLDSRTAESIFEIFLDLARSGKTIIMVTHDPGLAGRTDRTILLSDGEQIDERVARALPAFSHPRLLWLSHRLEPRFFAPGEILADREGSRFGLILVTGGGLELIPNGHLSWGDSRPAILGAGDFISAFDGSLAAASIDRLQAAGEDGLEALVLEPRDLDRWLGEAPADREKLLRLVQDQRTGAERVSSQMAGEHS